MAHPVRFAVTLGIAAGALALLSAGAVGAVGAGGPGGRPANDPQVSAPYAVSGQEARFPTNKQNEPTMARNPQTGKFVAGANDEQRQPACGPGAVRGSSAPANDCSFFKDVGTTPIYTSDDGQVWTNRGMLPGFTDPAAGANLAPGETARNDLVSDGDPVLAYGPRWTARGGFDATRWTAYYASLASYAAGQQPGQQVPELLTVSRSDDDGLSWSAPVVAADGHGTIFNDKESLWADRNPSSPYFGRLYLSWTQFRGGGAEPINLAFSNDGGRSWSKPNQLSSAYNNKQGGRQGSVVRTGQDGAVYVVWEDGSKGQPVQVVSVSRDGGLTFSRSRVIGPVTDIADPLPGSNFRTNSFPTVAVQQASAPYKIYVAWTNRTSPADADVVVAQAPSTDLGAWRSSTVSTAGEGYDFYPAIDVASNGRVDLGWQAQQQTSGSTYGTGNARVTTWYSALLPGGSAWTAPISISAASDPSASSQNDLSRQFWGDYNTMVSSPDGAYLIYTDARSGTGCTAVDDYQHAVDAGTNAVKPAPGSECSRGFGDTDVYVSKVGY